MVTAHGLSGFSRRIPWCVLEELAQEATLRTLQVPADNPAAFARRTARNLAIDWLRRQREEALDEQHAGGDPWQVSDARLDVEAALSRAPARHRTLLARLYLREESLADLVAEEVGGSREQVGEDVWGRGRDALYKRRRRSLDFFAERLAS
jgi:DNA-directed RNA polymerase specialized sigma24 family protein